MNKIICGDALSELTKIESDSVDLIITSPPYFNQRQYQEISDPLEIGQEKEISDYLNKLVTIFGECVRVCKMTGNMVINIGDIFINKRLQLIPYKFAQMVIEQHGVFLINTINWIKTNPTPRQYKKRLVPSTEPFFHFAKSEMYYYDLDSFLRNDSKKVVSQTDKKGKKYEKKIMGSSLSPAEKINAINALRETVEELRVGKIADFRMNIRGIHKRPFGGQQGGRNNQITNNGFTVIKFRGEKLKRDVIESPGANTKDINHPAVFPLKVINELVSLLSKEGDLVLDPFCGSGQTCVSANSLNRSYIGIDISKKYCEIAEQRLLRKNE